VPTTGEQKFIRPVILCGGAGTRLWPLSRPAFPKQFLTVFGDASLLQQTARRVSNDRFGRILVVSGEQQRHLVQRQLESVDLDVEVILLEPEGRNTAAAATLAAKWLAQTGDDEPMLLVPSDHVIADVDAFFAALDKAREPAEQGAIVTFGAEPTDASTQYGYIEADREGSANGAFPIGRFVEKPDAATAAEYLASGRFLWNAGIFLVKPSVWLDEMRAFLPKSLDAISGSIEFHTRDGQFVRPEARQFAAAENISIDHGIMEKTSRGMVVPVRMQWSDVGSWDAVWRLGDKDAEGNLVRGEAISIDTRNSLLQSDGKLVIATIGLEDMAVVASAGVVLVSSLARVSQVKDIVSSLRAESCEPLPDKTGLHPWGTLETIRDAPFFQIHHAVVHEGRTLAMRSHARSSIQLIVVRGSGTFSDGNSQSPLQAEKPTAIDLGTPFEISNSGDAALELLLIEVGLRPDALSIFH
jgi:mannose-1-phosphate guanylyltransferase/mannose-6-phosphate isomerase